MSVDKGIFHPRQRQAETFDYHTGVQPTGPWQSDVQIERYVPTHCCYCGVQCGMYLKVARGKVVGVEPRAPAASPRKTLVGHTIGVLAGYFSLLVTGLTAAGPALAVGVTWPRVIAAALSLGLTAGLMVLCKSPHPPAGATTLIISLGILTKPWQLVLLLIAVVLLTMQAFAINRLAGIPYPLWSPIKEKEGDPGQSG